MKLEDMCLTIEQARELKELGIDFSNSIYEFVETYDEYEDCNEVIICEREYVTIEREIFPTLTNTELLEMLPKVLDYEGIRNDNPLRLTSGKQWSVLFHGPINELDYESISDSLRDALFDMIKWLKINKII